MPDEFDYRVIDREETERTLRMQATNIRRLRKQLQRAQGSEKLHITPKVGRQILFAYRLCPEPVWEMWLKAACEIDVHTASRYVAAAAYRAMRDLPVAEVGIEEKIRTESARQAAA